MCPHILFLSCGPGSGRVMRAGCHFSGLFPVGGEGPVLRRWLPCSFPPSCPVPARCEVSMAPGPRAARRQFTRMLKSRHFFLDSFFAFSRQRATGDTERRLR